MLTQEYSRAVNGDRDGMLPWYSQETAYIISSTSLLLESKIGSSEYIGRSHIKWSHGVASPSSDSSTCVHMDSTRKPASPRFFLGLWSLSSKSNLARCQQCVPALKDLLAHFPPQLSRRSLLPLLSSLLSLLARPLTLPSQHHQDCRERPALHNQNLLS
jgi:hypothetical protein